MLFIYIPQVNNRLHYVFDYIFDTYLKVPYTIISESYLLKDDDIVISYKSNIQLSKVHFGAHDLLFERDIRNQNIQCFEHNGEVVFFETTDIKSILPYDPFALCFYMLSRYEEYLEFPKDEHGRFPAARSLAAKNNFLQEPIVDRVIQEIVSCIKLGYAEFLVKEIKFDVEISYDVDAPFAFRGKGFFKNLFGSFKMLGNGKIKQGLGRLAYCLAGGRDPFDQFFNILSLLDELDHKAIFFLLMENKGEHNPSISYKHYAFDILVDKLARFQTTGIHPSYNCNTTKKLKEEMYRYEKLLSKPALHSRNHFIQIQFPLTYQLLLENGISDDYSMGFPEQPGFRAGICRPFPFYDIEKEKCTHLTIHPFMAMDASFEYYHPNLTEQEIFDATMDLFERTALYCGVFHMVFHNDLVSGYLTKLDWKMLHEKFLWAIRQDKSNLTV